jgi:hypothetical protein
MPGNIVGEPPVTLLHRSVLADYGPFNPDLLQLLDLEMWCRIATNENTCYVPEPLVRFRVHQAGESARNRAGRLFRVQVVDAVLLAYEFAFSPLFGSLRRIAGNFQPPVDVVDVFYERAHWAMEEAAALSRSDSTEPRAALDALEQVASRYPNLMKRPPLKYVLARKWRSLKKLMRGAQAALA